MMKIIAMGALLGLVVGCGGEGLSPEAPIVLAHIGVSAAVDADARSSYSYSTPALFLASSQFPMPHRAIAGDLRQAVAYLDVDGDGDTDVFVGTGRSDLAAGSAAGATAGAPAGATGSASVQSVLIINEIDSEGDSEGDSGGGEGLRRSVAEFDGDMPPMMRARKSLVSDFNNDSLLDILVLDRGYEDASPVLPGKIQFITQESTGVLRWRTLDVPSGFYHSGAAGDVDNDGDVDVFVGGYAPFFLVNNGLGAFTAVYDRFDRSLGQVLAAELIDVDQDGFLDLLLGGYEREGDRSAIYWGSSTGSYSVARRTVLPPVALMGAILDFDAEDLDGDGDRDLLVNRSRDGNDGLDQGLLQGHRLQVLRNNGGRVMLDITRDALGVGEATRQTTGAAAPWMRLQDVDHDGDIDLIPDDQDFGFQYRNTSQGEFVLFAEPVRD